MSKLPHVGTTIFTTMSKMAAEHHAINLSQGFPNFPVDQRLIDTMKSAVDSDVHQYMPMPGYPALLDAIQLLIKTQYNRSLTHENLLVTAGATQGIFTSILALVEKGQEVIILDPSYDCYEPAVVLAGGVPVRIPLNDNFLPDWDLITSKISDKTRMIVVNNPHNPSGVLWQENDLNELKKIVQENDQLLILSDEVYEYITFEMKHLSVHTDPTLSERSIIISSFGKTFHITGWKIGYLVAHEELMKEIRKVHQYNVFCVNSIAQYALANYIGQIDVSKLGAFYQEKRDLFQTAMKNSRFGLLPSQGSYFQLAKYDAISDIGDIDFCEMLIKNYGVAAIPISVFSEKPRKENYIRFCFAKDDKTLQKATERLCKI